VNTQPDAAEQHPRTAQESAAEAASPTTGRDDTSPPLPWSAGAAYIDGAFCPIEAARISILDMGVTRSDCTYDVVGVWRGRFFRLDAHLDRFFASMQRLRLDPGRERAVVEEILHECVSRSGLRDAYVSMTTTRGRSAPGSRDLRTARNTFYSYAIPFVWIVTPADQATGVGMWISDAQRIPPASIDPTVKNYHWLDMDLAQLDAYDHDARLVVLRDATGAVTEGPGYNLFVHLEGRWLTPRSGTLRGITRRSVIEIIRDAGGVVEERRVAVDDLVRGSEVLVTSTAGGVMPVTAINGQPVGDGEVGPLTRAINERYWDCHADPGYTTPVRYGCHDAA
jgi:branched-chain amino acid aminotransferase